MLNRTRLWQLLVVAGCCVVVAVGIAQDDKKPRNPRKDENPKYCPTAYGPLINGIQWYSGHKCNEACPSAPVDFWDYEETDHIVDANASCCPTENGSCPGQFEFPPPPRDNQRARRKGLGGYAPQRFYDHTRKMAGPMGSSIDPRGVFLLPENSPMKLEADFEVVFIEKTEKETKRRAFRLFDIKIGERNLYIGAEIDPRAYPWAPNQNKLQATFVQPEGKPLTGERLVKVRFGNDRKEDKFYRVFEAK